MGYVKKVYTEEQIEKLFKDIDRILIKWVMKLPI